MVAGSHTSVAKARGELAALLRGRRVAVLTGAGISTESGIPDYRGPGTERRARNPVRFQTYLDDERARRQYWARSVVGWRRVADARPNPGHLALAALERAGVILGVITQNVDRLHHKAGSRRVIELHGALADVVCLRCGQRIARSALQRRLLELNPTWDSLRAHLAPDGDADVRDDVGDRFVVADCQLCNGPFKPDVVFFGESVPRQIVTEAFELVADADALLVVGTSLTVYSGLRFVRRAAERGIPIALVNVGATRGDSLCTLRIDGRAGTVLSELAQALVAVGGGPSEHG